MATGGPSLSELYGQCIRYSGNHPACDEFFRHLNPILIQVASRIARQYDAYSEAEDMVQEISLKLISSGESILASLPAEQPATQAYFSVLAANASRDILRARKAIKRGMQSTVSLDVRLALICSDDGVVRTTDRDVLMGQIEECLPDDQRGRVIFRLYYRQGMTAKEIASIPALNLTVKGVESVLFRLTKQIRARLRPASGEELRLGQS